MSDERRLEQILTALRREPDPPLACPEHAERLAGLAKPNQVLLNEHVSALASSLSCPACREVLLGHPTLHLDALDLALPPPVFPARSPRPRVRHGALAIAIAATVLFTALGATLWPAGPDTRPGPTENGHAAYAFVVPTGPMITGSESYAWVPRPPAAESYDYTMPEPRDEGELLLAARVQTLPWRWR
jgi:hypothetical protein